MADVPSVVLIVPCFNEAERWDPAYWRDLVDLLNVELVFVNDGSSDATRHCIQDLLDDSRIKLLELQGNSGKAEAVRRGFLSVSARSGSEAQVIGFLDADGAFEGSDILRMLRLSMSKFASGYDALWSSRVALRGRRIEREARRHYIGRGIATLLGTGEPALPYDSQSGFKLFRVSDELWRVFDTPFATRWLFDVEILGRWRQFSRREIRIWEEPVLAWIDVSGSKIRGPELVRILKEILIVRRYSRSSAITSPEES